MSDPIRIYVAGASAEIGRVEAFLALCRENGIYVTHDWTRDVRLAQAQSLSDTDIPREMRAMLAMDNARGIRDADYVVLLRPAVGIISRGLYWETGYAQGRGSVIIASGPEQSIFDAMIPSLYVAADDVDVLRILRSLTR